MLELEHVNTNYESSCKSNIYYAVALVLLFIIGGVVARKFVLALYHSAAVMNSIIALTCIVSVALVMRYLISVSKEIESLREFKCWSESPDVSYDYSDAALSLLRPVLGPLNKALGENGSLAIESASELRSIVESIEQNIESRKSLVNFLAGFLVLLGLFGTFLGLTITLQSMGQILDSLASGLSGSGEASILKVMVQLIVQLKKPMAGMGTAFSTSLAGLTGSALVGLLSLFMAKSHDQLKNRVELWLGSILRGRSSSSFSYDIETEGDGSVSKQFEALSNRIDKNNELLTASFEKTNKFLLEITLMQQRTSEIQRVILEQAEAAAGSRKLGNDLSGRLIEECRHIKKIQVQNLDLLNNGSASFSEMCKKLTFNLKSVASQNEAHNTILSDSLHELIQKLGKGNGS